MESPEFTNLTGNGTFAFHDATVESSFALCQNPYWIGVVAEGESLWAAAHKSFSATSTICLTGTLDDGRPVKADPLHASEISPVGSPPVIEFAATEGARLGQEGAGAPNESRYALVNYFDGAFSFSHDDWNINTIPCANFQTAQSLAKKWHTPVEGMTLQLKRESATMDQHRHFAQTVMTLLSLASGTGVSSHRHYFTWTKEEIEIWRKMTGDEIGPGAIVPEFEITNFIEQTLPRWQSLSTGQQKALRLALHHINLSAVGYLDTRLFHVVQPWEFLADAWGIHGVLPEPIVCLRSRLQRTRKQWKEDHGNSDPDGFWGSRIASIFDWPKLRDAIEQLAAEFGLDLERVGLDLNLLKKARDSVAHSGKLSEFLTEPQTQAIDILTTGQYCLQLLLLRILGYQGRVYHATGGWRTIVEMGQALTIART